MTFPSCNEFVAVLGRSLTEGDTVAPETLVAAEQRLGITLPEAVAAFYRQAGAAPELQEHDTLRAPEALEVDDGFLVFMDENQNVVEWGIRLLPDVATHPEVWQRPNDQPTWHRECMTFIEFIVKRLAWTRGV